MLDHPAVILVRPQMGENIGATARAMLNFGLEHLRLVAPRDGWPNPRAAALASGAGRVLDNVQVYDDLRGAQDGFDFIMATTARGRDLAKPVFTPEGAVEEMRTQMQAGARVAVMFGPERSGLENDDLAAANALITIPVNPDFASLNLAQSVLLMGYEWRKQTTQNAPMTQHLAGSRWPAQAEIQALADHYEDRLDEAGFFFPAHKAAPMKQNLRNLWSRLPLNDADIRMFHGMLRQLIRAHKDKG